MWREITEDDVLNVLNGAELEAYRTVLANIDQSDGDILPTIIGMAVQQARGHIADCRSNKLAEGNTVPERVLADILAIIRYQLLTRLDLHVTDDRKTEYTEARRFFERVSECKVAIEYPAGETEDSGNTTDIDVVSSSPKVFTRETLRGL